MNKLIKRGYSFNTVPEWEIVQDAIKKLCYMVFDYDTEHKILTLFQRTVVHMTNSLMVLAPSTMTSRWLLRFSVDWRIYLVYEFLDRSIITVVFNVSVAWKCYFCQGSPASGFHDTSLQSNMKWDYMSDVGYVCILND